MRKSTNGLESTEDGIAVSYTNMMKTLMMQTSLNALD